MKVRHPTLRVVGPKDAQCDGKRCTTTVDATPIYGDTHHIQPFGSVALARISLARLGNPFTP